MTNREKLQLAVALVLTNDKFMDDNSKVNKAIDALTPKSTASSVLKRLQGNAKRDFLDKKDAGVAGYAEENRVSKIKEYIFNRFKSYMESPRTSAEATTLFNAAYPTASVPVGEDRVA